ncbi:excinuclease ABC subunit UvrC [Desulfotomaculum copahuensis]|uniref:UvrABC system protein C n=1 Tax=Desulfotomaculum copahuensis TaxID=1838280 RepID=A0A1B7LC18_9FIRM|nr:excinuclease ABC subunit UvrC [Desulfotomaculum copahuensis]OAT80214.1 excinuclease ABC subunit C [Desulfotomaculum copahuensis]
MTAEEKLQHLPDRPGVYIFHDAGGEIIYVGKAVSLKNRVRSYFQSGARQSVKVRSLMNRAADFEYIVTDNEVEALILESNLIKEHRPRYNIYLKDDKSYPYLKVTLAEDFPRIFITRRVVRDGSRYFGPYTMVGAVHETLKLLRQLFPFRTCKQKLAAPGEPERDAGAGKNGAPAEGLVRAGSAGAVSAVPQSKPVGGRTGGSGVRRACLNHHIGRCPAPCAGMITRDEYRGLIREICLFLEGRHEDLLKSLKKQMEEAADQLAFERAARLRDQIRAVERVLESQKIVSSGAGDRDVVALARDGGESSLMVFFVRGGKLLGREHFLLSGTEGMERGEVVAAFVKQYYHRADFVPPEIVLSEMEAEELPAVEQWLSGRRGGRVHINVPQRGEKKKLVEMAGKNALLALQEAQLNRLAGARAEQAPAELARALGLDNVPERMECYDISNTQGSESVGSMVVFEAGRPARDQYRRFKIRTVKGPDDYASLQEVLRRRFSRAREERELINTGQLSSKEAKFHRLPGLVIIDGGKGQLSAARAVMRELGFDHIPAFGLAKEEELLFAEDRSEPVRLPPESQALHLVQRLRDEAHRFAVTYHRQLRTKRNLKSLLDEVAGVGPARRRALLRAYPSLEAMSRAALEELAAVPGMNRPAAEAVHRFLHGEKD